jgi:hypothetical protein
MNCELLKSGDLPGRKVGHKWITTRSAVMRWVEQSITTNAAERAMLTAERAIQSGDKAALAKALQSGAVRVKAAYRQCGILRLSMRRKTDPPSPA